MREFFKNAFSFNFKSGKEFDFQSYLLSNNFINILLDENQHPIDENIKIYSHRFLKIKLIINFSNQTLSVHYNSELVSLLNFIPSGELFADMFLNQVSASLKNN